MIAIEDTIKTTLNIIPATVNGVPPDKRKDCLNFIEAKRPMARGKFPALPLRSAGCVTENSSEDQCYNYHLQRRSLNIQSICDTYKKCPDCCHVYELKNRSGRGGDRRSPDYACGWGECRICVKKVFLPTHQCYIQRIPVDEDEPKKKRVPRDEVKRSSFRGTQTR